MMFGPVEEKRRIAPAQWWIISLAIAFMAGSVLYRYLMHAAYGHTAAMFVGVPAVLAIALALTPKAKTVTGGIMKGITLALLVLAPLLGEGYLCILMAAPLFYVVGLLVGISVDGSRKRDRDGQTLSCIVLLLLPMSLEGVIPQFAFDRRQAVEVTHVVDAPVERVEGSLANSPRIAERLPGFLRIGFPHPMKATGSGLAVGAKREILFSGAEGDPAGWLAMRVTERRPGYARFETVSDGSKLTQWIRWDASEVTWTPVDANHTRVTWRVHFERELDPAWYFTPWERAAVQDAAKYLIEVNATPESARR
ncbi:MAG TPA: SRPBCC family protein [Terracidiphilus sp.]|jgi:hypothetical protein